MEILDTGAGPEKEYYVLRNFEECLHTFSQEAVGVHIHIC